MKFFSYICKCVALDTGMCDRKSSEQIPLISNKFPTFGTDSIYLIKQIP